MNTKPTIVITKFARHFFIRKNEYGYNELSAALRNSKVWAKSKHNIGDVDAVDIYELDSGWHTCTNDSDFVNYVGEWLTRNGFTWTVEKNEMQKYLFFLHGIK